MKVELMTVGEAKDLGLVQSRLSHEGHGAFGEPDNSYEYYVWVGKKIETLWNNDDIIIFKEKTREVLQILSQSDCSDRLLEVINFKALEGRKTDKYKRFLELSDEIKKDDFYKTVKIEK